MLIDSRLSEKTFTLAKNKTSVDSAEVQEHLQRIHVAVEKANTKHQLLKEHATGLEELNATLTGRIAELEANPDPTEQQIRTIELAQTLHQRIVEEAEAAAAKLKEESLAQASEILKEAKEEGERTVESLSDQVNTLKRRIEKLSQFEREHFDRLSAFLNGQVQSLGTSEPEKLSPPE